jgi:hypothetical protein
MNTLKDGASIKKKAATRTIAMAAIIKTPE